MDISSLLIRIVFLVLPGIICRRLYRSLIGKRVQKDWEDFSEILIFSLISYLVYGVAILIVNKLHIYYTPIYFTTFQAWFDEKVPIHWFEIVWASAVSLIIAFFASAINKYKVINTLGKFFRVTDQMGETDIWDYLHKNSTYEWFVIRDLKFDLAYFGWIEAFSDSGDKRELIIREVDVYSNATGILLYSADVVYCSRDQYDISIEVPNLTNGSLNITNRNQGDGTNG